MENQAITVRTPEGVEVSRTVTKPDGTYEIQSLTDGDYVVSVGDNVRVDLSVAPDATINTLDIVMPPGTVMPPATPPGGAAPAPATPARNPAPSPTPAPAAAPVAGGGLGVVGWGLIAVGATAAVAIPVVIAAQDDDEKTVSPAGSRIRR